jgi:NAD(P)-dependent dehydrogenase (short-subunit alcohol dehydrogenase family)
MREQERTGQVGAENASKLSTVCSEVGRCGLPIPALLTTATKLTKQMSPETYRTVVAKISRGSPGRPEEVAAMIAWLASDGCSFSTGATFDLSDGRATY